MASNKLRFESGEVFEIKLDQGVSYWRTQWTPPQQAGWGPGRYDFSASVAVQGERIAQLNLPVFGQGFPTYVSVKKCQ